MKTLTEFSGFTLKEAIAKKAALLAEGKTEDEAQAAVNEMLKLDEAKTPFYKNAVDMTGSRIDRVKRVVVATKASETEKVPDSFMEREGNFYLVEFFPQASERGARKEETSSYHDDFARGRTGGGGRGRGGDRGRGRGGRESGDRGRGGDRPQREMRGERGPRPEGDRGPRPPRGNRPPRQDGERKPRAPRESSPRGDRGPRGAGELRLVLKGQTTTLPGSGPDTAPAGESASSTKPV